MRDEYDIKSLNPRRNPYADKLKKQITIRLNAGTIEYFKRQAEETGISYQNLINMYLTDCAVHEKKLEYTIKYQGYAYNCISFLYPHLSSVLQRRHPRFLLKTISPTDNPVPKRRSAKSAQVFEQTVLL